MTTHYKKNTAPDSDAVNEKNINTLQLLQEIEPLLKEYFIGDFEIENNSIKMTFKNSQTFNLIISEIVKNES